MQWVAIASSDGLAPKMQTIFETNDNPIHIYASPGLYELNSKLKCNDNAVLNLHLETPSSFSGIWHNNNGHTSLPHISLQWRHNGCDGVWNH